MKIRPDDPRITAYHLGELSSDESRAVERAAAVDPAVRIALRDMGGFTGFLEDTLGTAERRTLRPAQREAVRRAGREADQTGKVVELKSSKRSARPWLTGLGAAAAVAFAAVLMSRLGDDAKGPTAREVALLPQPGPSIGDGATGAASGGGGAGGSVPSIPAPAGAYLESVANELSQGALPRPDELPMTADQSSFSRSKELRLPVSIGTASAIWVRRWIEEKDQLPPTGAVRVEEMVNGVTLPTDRESHGLKIGLHRLDWGGSRWLGVQLTAGGEDVADLELRSISSSARRVVGSFGAREDEALPARLDAGRSSLVLIEFEEDDASLGRLELRFGDEREVFDLDAECRTGQPAMTHAVATATFGRWLRGEAGADRLQQAIEMAASETGDPVHRENRRLMMHALALAGAAE